MMLRIPETGHRLMINYQLKTKSRISSTTDFKTCELSVLLGMDNLSYTVYDRQQIDVLYLNALSYKFSPQPNTLIKRLEDLFNKETELNKPYSRVNVIYQNHWSTLVPNDLYNADLKKDYLKYSLKVYEDDAIDIDVLPEMYAKNIYLYPRLVDDFFNEKFTGKVQRKHHASVLINALMRYFSTTDKSYLFINVYQHTIQIIHLKSGRLQFYNSFLYDTKEDFMYYVLFVMEQLGLDPDRQPVTFLGQITTDDDVYKIAYQYIRHLNFFSIDNFNISDAFYTDNPQIQKHFYFELLNQL
ncbi:MAG: hypothetical protein CR968_00490 [Flavobacteriia bacterium]|nr:MAG: hypothetical protein CR968_00490 [Flavobacteriia bacterium]